MDVFISYSRADQARAEEIKARLEAFGLSIFFDLHFDHEGINPGDNFPQRIAQAVEDAKVVVGLWTPKALSSEWCRIECYMAKEHKKLLPALIAPMSKHQLKEFIAVSHTDLSDFTGQAQHSGWSLFLLGLAMRLRAWAEEQQPSDPEARAALEKAERLSRAAEAARPPNAQSSTPDLVGPEAHWEQLQYSDDIQDLLLFAETFTGTNEALEARRRAHRLQLAADASRELQSVNANSVTQLQKWLDKHPDHARSDDVRRQIRILEMEAANAVAERELEAARLERERKAAERAEAKRLADAKAAKRRRTVTVLVTLVVLAVLVSIPVYYVYGGMHKRVQDNWRIDHPLVEITPAGREAGVSLTPGPVLELGGEAETFVFTRDGKSLVVGLDDGALAVWDVASATQATAIPAPPGLERRAAQLMFDPSGERLLVSDDRYSDIFLLDFPSGEVVQRLARPKTATSDLLEVEFSPDGKRLAGTYLFRLYVWDLETGEMVFARDGDNAQEGEIAWSNDGRLLASGFGLGRPVRLLDARTGRIVRTLDNDCKWLGRDMSYTRDGSRLVLWDSRGSGIVCDVASGKPIARRDEPKPDKRETQWRALPSGAVLEDFALDETPWRSGPISPDGSLSLETYGPFHGEEEPEGLAMFDYDNIWTHMQTLSRVWDGTPLAHFSGNGRNTNNTGAVGYVREIAFSADGVTFATLGSDDRIRLWTYNRQAE